MEKFMPKSEDVLKVIKTFEKLPESIRKEENVNMSESRVKDAFSNKCGTIMCHGGWYAALTVAKNPLKFLTSIDYIQGAEKMAVDLGFKSRPELVTWATQNPEIWGNRYGCNMFMSSDAFSGHHLFEILSIQDIINHWRGVYQRLVELENPKPTVKLDEVYPDITQELAVLPKEEKEIDIIRETEKV